METPPNLVPGIPIEQEVQNPVPVPRIVRPGALAEQPDNRLSRYRDRYPQYSSQVSRFRELQLEHEMDRKRPPSVFLTLKFWRGFLLIAVLNMAAFTLLRNLDASWLIRPVPVKIAQTPPVVIKWPQGLPPLEQEKAADGEILTTVPTKMLTPQDQEKLKKYWESQRTATPQPSDTAH
jgi:hypothetical protein